MKNLTAATIAITLVLLVHNYEVQADEVTPQPKPIHNTVVETVTDFVQSEWTEIKEYQQSSWEQGKEQLAQNKQQIKSLFQKVLGQN